MRDDEVFNTMEKHNIILSIDLADGAEQVGEMNEIIAEFPKLKIAIGALWDGYPKRLANRSNLPEIKM